MVSENGYVWLQLSTAPCRHGGSTTSTAAATYLRRSSRWAGLHKSNDQFSHNRSNCTAGWVGGVTLRGWVAVTFSCSSLPYVALPPLSSRWMKTWVDEMNFSEHHDSLHSYSCSRPNCVAFIWQITRGNLTFLGPTLMRSAFLPQAFLGDLFSKHQKEVSSEKLEEYTDTMVGTPALIAGPSQT